MRNNLVVALIIIGSFALLCKAAGPIYQHKDNATQREFQNIYDQLKKMNSYLAPASNTLAQLKALSPPSSGLIYFCSDCTVDGIVISTGTSKGAFGRISSRTTAIQ